MSVRWATCCDPASGRRTTSAERGTSPAPSRRATRRASPSVTMEQRRIQSTSLIDILDRILDKGLVVAGDIRVSLANVELLTIRIRLLVCSIDKAEQIGLNWWRYDTALVAQEETTTTIARLER